MRVFHKMPAALGARLAAAAVERRPSRASGESLGTSAAQREGLPRRWRQSHSWLRAAGSLVRSGFIPRKGRVWAYGRSLAAFHMRGAAVATFFNCCSRPLAAARYACSGPARERARGSHFCWKRWPRRSSRARRAHSASRAGRIPCGRIARGRGALDAALGAREHRRGELSQPGAR